jgi:hypothetical protein
MRIKSLQDVETTQTSPHSLEDQGRSLLSSLRNEAQPHQLQNENQNLGGGREKSPTPAWGLFIVKTED